MKYGLRPMETSSSPSITNRDVQSPDLTHPVSISDPIPTAMMDQNHRTLRMMKPSFVCVVHLASVVSPPHALHAERGPWPTPRRPRATPRRNRCGPPAVDRCPLEAARGASNGLHSAAPAASAMRGKVGRVACLLRRLEDSR